MILLLLACASPPSPSKTSVDTSPSGTCDPGVASLSVPDFHAEWKIDSAQVSPAEIDPTTDLQPDDVHEIRVLSDGATRDALFVMLPGTDGKPENNQNILTIAAESGYRSIGLAYPTDTNQNDACGTDEDCATAFTREKLYGNDETPVIDINEPNSIVGRLTRLLHALDKRFPGAGWDSYLDGDQPKWSSIVISGFSQGSGMAGWLSKDYEFARFVAFSSGCDSVGTSEADGHPADWCFESRATPAERSFGILHTEDDFVIKRQIYEDAFDLDQFGTFADADTGAPDYCTGTHILTTSLPPGGTDPQAFHKSLATDPNMPVDEQGVPLLAEDQWYLLAGG